MPRRDHVELDVRKYFAATLRRLAVVSIGALALSGTVSPLAGADPVAATVSISNPADGTTYAPRTWNSTVTGEAIDGTSTVDTVDIKLYDSTASLYFDGVGWGASATTFTANGTNSWSTTVYPSFLPIDHQFEMTATANLVEGGTVDSVTVNFSYTSSVLNFACNSNPNLFNTGFNANTGSTLSDYSADSYWTVTGPGYVPSGASLPPAGATYTSASVNNLIAASWYTTPFYNSQWISQQNLDNPYQYPQNDPLDYWYQLKFNLGPTTDPSTFQIPFDWYADNNIFEIYVNGVAQSAITTGIPQDATGHYDYNGYTKEAAADAVLRGAFVTGENTIIVQIKTDNDYEGFNAVFRPSSVCPVDLSVTKTASQSPAYLSSQSLSYVVTVANAGPGTAYNVGLVDSLPAGLPTSGANRFTWTCAKVDSNSRCATSGNTNGSGNINETIYRISPGGSVKYTITGTIPAGTHVALDNTATVTPAADSSDVGCSPNCASTVTLPPVTTDLSVTKVASSSQYTAGNPLTYTITVNNAGPDTATNATVVDTLPAGLPTTGAGAFTWTCVATGSATCSASGTGNLNDTVTIPKDAKVVYTVTGTVPLGTTASLVNTATVTPPPGVYDANCLVSCSDATTVSNVPATKNITILKTVDKPVFTPGESLTYTVKASNKSDLDVSGVDVTDTLPAGLPTTGANAFTWSCAANDVIASPTTPSACPNANGTGNLSETGIAISAGGSVVYTITGTVPSSLTTSLSNTATLFPHVGSDDPSCNPSCSSTVTSTPHIVVDLVPSKTASPTSYVAGARLTYTVIVANNGPSDAKNTKVADTLPAGLPTSGPSRFTWTCVGTAGSTCTASGVGNIRDTVTVIAGGKVTYTVTGIVPASLTGNRTNTVTVTPPAGATDPGCTPTCSRSVKTAASISAISVATKATVVGENFDGAAPKGSQIQYTFSVKNTGNTELTSVSVRSDRVGVSCPKTKLAPGETMQCVGTSLHKVSNADLIRTYVPNQATASGVSLNAGPVKGVSNEVITPTAGGIPTDLGMPHSPSSHGLSNLALFGILGSGALALGLLLRRKNVN